MAELAQKAASVESCTSGFTPGRGGSSVSVPAGRKPTDGASRSNCVTVFPTLYEKKGNQSKRAPGKMLQRKPNKSRRWMMQVCPMRSLQNRGSFHLFAVPFRWTQSAQPQPPSLLSRFLPTKLKKMLLLLLCLQTKWRVWV